MKQTDEEKLAQEQKQQEEQAQATPDSGAASEPSREAEASAAPADEHSTTDDPAGAEQAAGSDESPRTETSATDTDAVEAAAAPPPERKQKVSKVGLLALLLALIALGGLGYGYLLIQKMHAEVVADNERLAAEVSQSRQAAGAAAQRAASLEQALARIEQQSKGLAGEVRTLQDRLTRAMQQISTANTGNRRDWLLAEAEYLLRLANQRVLLENSPNGALALLRSADRILMESDDVSLYDVRKALAADIAALEAVPPLDVDGIFLRLAALDAQVDKLRLLPATERHELPEMLKAVTPEAVEESWQSGLAEGWASAMEKLGKLIVIRHEDEPVEPLLSPEQTFFLRQNLHLMLEQAQLALLQGKQQAFDEALAKAERWIGRYFTDQDATTRALLKGLAELKGTQVAPPLPDISGSLRTLKDFLARRHDGQGGA